MTLGSLFDGSGGFPLAAKMVGITPVWSSEIEPFAILVEHKNLPAMKHYGDVRRLRGDKLEPVDIITFGSPCQDMSVAGDRAGLEGSRSGLFYEAVRIIKEMREATDGRYPRYAVWENVPGAFSSNGGEDFGEVLRAMCGIREKVSIPGSDHWAGAGEILGDGFSLAWRTLDAQFWGVPQRRRRIFLVTDLRGQSAGKILFESKSMQWNPPESWREGERTPGRTEDRFGETICLNDQGGSQMDVSDVPGTLRAQTHGHPPCVVAVENYPTAARAKIGEKVQTLTSRMGTGGNNTPLVMSLITSHTKGHSMAIQEEQAPTITVGNDSAILAIGNGQANQVAGDKVGTLNCMHDQQAVMSDHSVRRLTPTECARLQGFPDWWCKGLENPNPCRLELDFWSEVWKEYGKAKTEKQLRKWLEHPHTDSAEYKLWGNGVALPCVYYIMNGIKEAENDKRREN